MRLKQAKKEDSISRAIMKKRRAVVSPQRSLRPKTEARRWCPEIRLPAANVAQSTQSREGHAIAADTALPSDARARRMFEWLIAPVTADDFYATYYEKRPFVVRRGQKEGGGDGIGGLVAATATHAKGVRPLT